MTKEQLKKAIKQELSNIYFQGVFYTLSDETIEEKSEHIIQLICDTIKKSQIEYISLTLENVEIKVSYITFNYNIFLSCKKLCLNIDKLIYIFEDIKKLYV